MPGGVREIPLTKGLVALVDADDFEWLSQWKWRASFSQGRVSAVAWIGPADNRRVVRLHRKLMCPPPGMVVDHIDGDTLNNTRANLRVCTQRENSRNRRKGGGANRFKGVYSDKRWPTRFLATIGVDYRSIKLGWFGSEAEAARAYDDAARKLHGEFARLNFPEAA